MYQTQVTLLAPASEFLKKGLLGKCILVFTCLNGQADFLNNIHISYIVNDPNTQKYANNATKLKENGIQIFKSMITNTCLSNIWYNLFRASQNLFWASQNHQLLAQHGKLVLKIMLVPATLDFHASRTKAVI